MPKSAGEKTRGISDCCRCALHAQVDRRASYLRILAGVLVCGARATVGAIAVHAALPDRPLSRSGRDRLTLIRRRKLPIHDSSTSITMPGRSSAGDPCLGRRGDTSPDDELLQIDGDRRAPRFAAH